MQEKEVRRKVKEDEGYMTRQEERNRADCLFIEIT